MSARSALLALWLPFIIFVALSGCPEVMAQDSSPLSLSISATPDPVRKGQTVIYTFTVSNRGKTNLAGVVVNGITPNYSSFHHSYALPQTGSGGTHGDGDPFYWTVGVLAAGESVNLAVAMRVSTAAPEGVVLKLQSVATATGVQEVTASATAQVISDPVLSLEMAANKFPATPGSIITYTVEYGNRGASNSGSATLEAVIPEGTSFVAADGGITPVSNVLSWPIGALVVGQSGRRSFQVKIDPVASSGDLVIAGAKIKDSLNIPNEARARVNGAVGKSPLVISFSTSPQPALPGAKLVYTFTVSNPGTEDLANVTVSALVPNYLSFHDSVALPQTEPYGQHDTGEPFTWILGTLPAGQHRTLNVAMSVDSSTLSRAGSVFRLEAIAKAAGLQETSLSKNEVVQVQPVLALQMSADRFPVSPNGVITCTLDFGNRSASSSGAANLEAILPGGTTFVSADEGIQPSNGKLRWPIGVLIAGQSGRRQFQVKVNSGAAKGSLIAAEAWIRDSMNIPNEARASMDGVVGVSPLAIAISRTPDPVPLQGHVSYSLLVSNEGSTDLANVEVSGVTPPYLSFHHSDAVPMTQSGGTHYSGYPFYWSVGTLAAGQNRTLLVTMAVNGSARNGDILRMPVLVGTKENAVQSANSSCGELVGAYLIKASASPSEGGTTTGGGGYPSGATAAVNAVAKNGYQFLAWKESGAAVSTSASYAFSVSRTRDLVAQFVQVVPPSRVLALSGSLAFGNVAVGSSATRTLTIANTGNSPLSVTGISHSPGVFSGNFSGTIAAGGTQNVAITFAPVSAASYSGKLTVASNATGGAATKTETGTGVTPSTYTLTVNATTGGTASKQPNSATYTVGSVVSVTATPLAGYQFTGWSGDANGNQNPLQVTMTGNKTVTANFTVVPGIATPVISPNGGAFSKKVSVNITCATAGVTIYYTTNGKEPTTKSDKFTKAFVVKKKNVTVKAKAFRTDLPSSATATAVFTKTK